MAMAGYDIEKELNDIRHRMHGTQFEQDMIIIADAISYIQKLKGMSANGSVKHGKWIDTTKIRWVNETNVPVVMCTECGIRFCDLINNHHYMYHYCPNCGARMDGE